MSLKPAARDTSELAWRKSSYSSSNEPGDCVEVAATPGTIQVRDSKNAEGPCLALAPHAWANFITYASTSI